ncbi:ccr4 associated factor [Neodidymelliopsis sp. IMI 364377]|nr:ccr4 associated factor [Neodidymelliopsis sp. IMI 364377]
MNTWRNARLNAGRTFSTASSSIDHNAPQRARYLSQWISRTAPFERATCPPHFARTNSRHYSTAIDAPQPVNSGIAALPHRRLVSIFGADSVKFLQGLITNNVDANRKEPFFAAFLDSRGRVLWDVFVWVYPELLSKNEHWGCYIEVDSSEVEALRKHLKRHKLRSKVNIEVVPEEELGIWAAWGVELDRVKQQAVVATLSDPRGSESALLRIMAKPQNDPLVDGVEKQDLQQYHLQRYKYGIAEGPLEISRESALPMEVNIDLAHGIDFKKGCYVGQELTIRTKHTGVVRKRILPVQLDFSGALKSNTRNLEVGTDIKQLDETGAIKKGRATGKFVAAIGDVGLALCRLEMMTPMKVSAEGGSYKEGMEFGMGVGDAGHVVKVKPQVQQWFSDRERQLWAKSKPGRKEDEHTE